MSPELFSLIPENSSPNIPAELRPPLRESLLLGKNIHRFTGDDLPSNLIKDNVHDHTLRLYKIANSLPLSPQLVTEIKTTVLIHDLPEIISLMSHGLTADLTAPEKAKNQTLANKVALQETKVASQIFNLHEMNLYEQFETASKFATGHEVTITPTGIIAKILDSLDANITLHHQLSLWAQSAACDLTLLKPERSLTYCFRQYLDLTPRLNQHTYLDPTNLNLICGLLEEQIHLIRQYWRTVPISNIPQEIRPFI